MFSYNFSFLKKIKQNRNPYVIVGNVVDYLQCVLKPVEDIKNDMLDFIDKRREKEKWTFQLASMEERLNNIYNTVGQFGLFPIRIETIKSATVFPLADENGGGSSALGTESTGGFVVPDHEAMLESIGVGFDFVIYVPPDMVEADREGIRREIDFYKYSGLSYEIRDNDDVIDNDAFPGLNEFTNE